MINRLRDRSTRYLNEKTRISFAAVTDAVMMVGILLMAAVILLPYYFSTPCRIEIDCRGRGINMAQINIWAEQEQDSYKGVRDIAGWRVEKRQTVSSVSTGRQKNTAVTGVYGTADLVYPAKILSGHYSLDKGEDYCILTAELSDALFGSTDTAGELVCIGGEYLAVAGVIDQEGVCLLHPIKENSAINKRLEEPELEYVVFRMSARYRAKENALSIINGL